MKTIITSLHWAAAMAAALPLGAQAQTGTPDGATVLRDIVVTATRSERPLSAIPGQVTVVDRAEIERQLAVSSDPADALSKLIPGYSASNQTISGSAETFRGRSLLVLVDGVPRNTPLRDVSRIVSLIDLNNVERIEVVSGASSLYGAGATGGTVNFITRGATPGAPRVTASTALRAFTADIPASLAPEASVGITGDAGIVDYAATVTGRLTRRTYDGRGRELPSDPLIGQGGADRYKDLNASAKVGRSFDGHRVELGGEWTLLNQDPDYLTDYTTSPVSPDRNNPYPAESIREDSKYLTGRYSNRDFALGTLDVNLFYNDIEKRFGFSGLSAANPVVYYSGNPAAPVSLDGQTTLTAERMGINVTVDTPLDRLWTGMKLTWGADYVHDETEQRFQDGVDAIAPMSQDSYAAFGQIEVPVGEMILLRTGVRHERFDLQVDSFTRPAYWGLIAPGRLGAVPPVEVIGGSFDYSETTFNLGAVVFLSDEVEAFGGFSQGFELPDVGSFTRRAGLGRTGTVDYSAIGPRAQVVNTYEAGLRGTWDRARGTVTAFVSTSDEGVNFNPATNTIVQQKERIHGFELTGEVDATDALTVGAVLAYREGRRDTNGDGELDAYLPNNRIASPLRGFLYADYAFENGLRVRPELEYLGGRDRDDGTTRVEIDSALLVNVSGSYPALGGELTFGARNLFDTDYENPTATATRNISVAGFGRTVSLGYRRSF